MSEKQLLRLSSAFSIFAILTACSYGLYYAFKYNKCTYSKKKESYKGLLIYMIVTIFLIGTFTTAYSFQKWALLKTMLALVPVILSSIVVSAGYHRYFAHRAFKAGVWYEYLVLILGPLSGAGHVLGWVGVHRLHHNHSDKYNYDK